MFKNPNPINDNKLFHLRGVNDAASGLSIQIP